LGSPFDSQSVLIFIPIILIGHAKRFIPIGFYRLSRVHLCAKSIALFSS